MKDTEKLLSTEKALEKKKEWILYQKIMFIIISMMIFLLLILSFAILYKDIKHIFQDKFRSINVVDVNILKSEDHSMMKRNADFSNSDIMYETNSLKEKLKKFIRQPDQLGKEYKTIMNDMRQASDSSGNSKSFKNIFFLKTHPEYKNIPMDTQRHTIEKVDEHKKTTPNILRLLGNVPDSFDFGFATTSSPKNFVNHKIYVNPIFIQDSEEISSESIEYEQKENSGWGRSLNKYYDDETFSDESDEQTETRALFDNMKLDKCDQFKEKIKTPLSSQTYMIVQLWITKKRLFYKNIFSDDTNFSVYLKAQDIDALMKKNIYFTSKFKEDILNPIGKTYLCKGEKRYCDYYLLCFRKHKLSFDEKSLMEKIIKYSEDYDNFFKESDKSERLGKPDHINDNNGLNEQSIIDSSSEEMEEDAVNESYEMKQKATMMHPFALDLYKIYNDDSEYEYI